MPGSSYEVIGIVSCCRWCRECCISLCIVILCEGSCPWIYLFAFMVKECLFLSSTMGNLPLHVPFVCNCNIFCLLHCLLCSFYLVLCWIGFWLCGFSFCPSCICWGLTLLHLLRRFCEICHVWQESHLMVWFHFVVALSLTLPFLSCKMGLFR